MQEYKNDKLVVRYDPAICIHAGECVRGLPSVFNLSRKPWIDVNGVSAAAVIEQVTRCPLGGANLSTARRGAIDPTGREYCGRSVRHIRGAKQC